MHNQWPYPAKGVWPLRCCQTCVVGSPTCELHTERVLVYKGLDTYETENLTLYHRQFEKDYSIFPRVLE